MTLRRTVSSALATAPESFLGIVRTSITICADSIENPSGRTVQNVRSFGGSSATEIETLDAVGVISE